MIMDVDVKIYLKRLKDFFNADETARRDMFGETRVDMDGFYKMVAEQATINLKDVGDPMLTDTQMLDIITDLAFEQHHNDQQENQKIFKTIIDGMPPFCLN